MGGSGRRAHGELGEVGCPRAGRDVAVWLSIYLGLLRGVGDDSLDVFPKRLIGGQSRVGLVKMDKGLDWVRWSALSPKIWCARSESRGTISRQELTFI